MRGRVPGSPNATDRVSCTAMCRLLGVVATTPAPIEDMVPDELPRLERLAAIHPHGWGVAHVTEPGTVEVVRAAEQAGRSETWRDALTDVTDAALLHIRQASPGMSHVMANTHPFPGDGMAFAHNGHADPTVTLDALVTAARAPTPIGDTDSERYWSLVRAGIATGLAPDQALLAAAGRIASEATATSLNALMLTPDALLAIAWWHEPVIRGAGGGETDRDYRLWYRVAADRVVVASAFVADDGTAWRELPHGHVLHIERATLRVRVTEADLRTAA